MAWGTSRFRSETLRMPVELEVLIPQAGYKSLTQKDHYKVIILLHSANNDRTEWLLKSQIYDMVRELPVLVVMPSGKNSFYVNTWNGYHYRDYVSEELPSFVKTQFSVSENREDWLIAGESMGGYGASVCGLSHPDTFDNIAVFSGALDVRDIQADIPGIRLDQVFGPDYLQKLKDEYDPFVLCQKVPQEKRPKMFVCCGEEDRLIDVNRKFVKALQNEYDVTSFWGRGGHEFQYWNEQLKKMFVWFMKEELSDGFFMGRNGNDFH